MVSHKRANIINAAEANWKKVYIFRFLFMEVLQNNTLPFVIQTIHGCIGYFFALLFINWFFITGNW